jgi:hypothetical protein
VNKVMKFWFSQNVEKSLSAWATGSFLRSALLHAVWFSWILAHISVFEATSYYLWLDWNHVKVDTNKTKTNKLRERTIPTE